MKQTRPSRSPPAWGVLLVFALAGPLVGAAPFALIGFLAVAVSASAPLAERLAGLSAISLVVLSVGLVFGIAPATATGVAAMLLRPRLDERFAYVGLCVLVGAATSWAFFALLSRSVESLWIPPIIGGFAALVCALLTWRR